MKAGRPIALGALAIALVFQLAGAGSALAGTGGASPGTVKQTTADSVAQASDEATAACASPASPECAAATDNAVKETSSFAGAHGGPTTDVGTPVLTDVHNSATGVVKSDNMTWLYNTRGTNGNFAGANFIHYENLGYDFMFGDGTGGLSIWSLKNPAAPLYVAAFTATQLEQPADSHGPADTTARFYEGENPTVDAKRKLVYLARDPRSFNNSSHPNGRTGLYVIDVKDPWHPKLLTFQWVPAGHTATCINDCRYIWSMGPANNGSHVNGQPQDLAGVLHPEWTGVPVFVTDVRDPVHPYTYAQPVDMLRNNNHTDYTHSADVDRNGVVWTSGFGGVRGFWTRGRHHDPFLNVDRWATAMDPIPYAGGTTPSVDLANQVDHNAYHVTQAPSDHSSKTVTAANGTVHKKADLLYITQENTVSCTSTSGGGSGRFVVASVAGSYNGQDWASTTTPTSKYFITKLGDYSPKNLLGNSASAGCSAHWFTVRGDMVAISFYGQGTRVLDVSDPTNPVQAGYIRIPSSPATNASATYWHDDYLYVADYSRGIDVERFTGEVKGVVQPGGTCWNSCGNAQLDNETSVPVTTATIAPPDVNGYYHDPTVTLSVDPGPDAAADAASQTITEFKVDGAASFTPYTAPFPVTGQGPHTVQYRSVNQSDQVTETTRSLGFTIDTAPPTTTASIAPAAPTGLNGWYLSPPSVTLAATDADSPVASTKASLDGGPWTDSTGPFSPTGQGGHSLAFYSTDAAGNQEPAQTFTWTVDTSPPTTTATLTPAIQNGWYASPALSFTVDDGSGSGNITDPCPPHVLCGYSTVFSVDGGPFLAYEDPAHFGNGNHFVQYRTTDKAGRVEATKLIAFRADSVKPTVTITAPADGAVIPLDKVATAKFKCTDALSKIGPCTGTVYNRVPPKPILNGGRLPTGDIGEHTVTVTGTDLAGNVTTKTVHYTVVYTWNGFFAPVTNTATSKLNLAHAGDLLKLSFGLNGNRGLGVLAYPPPDRSTEVPCPGWTPHNVPAAGAGGTAGLSFSASSGHYAYGWQTSSNWAGTCRRFDLQLDDGTPPHSATFRFFP